MTGATNWASASGSWDLSGNWDTGVVPTDTTDVIIDASAQGAVGDAIAGAAAEAARSITVSGTLSLNGLTFSTGSVVFAQPYTDLTIRSGTTLVDAGAFMSAYLSTVTIENGILTAADLISTATQYTLNGGSLTV